MDRTVLHIDCNKFYASVECLYRPEIRNKPVAVGGNPESRHGIILTKNEIASKYNLTVGEPLWKAKQKCPNLIIVPPNYPLYLKFSQMARHIYEDYSEYIEPFGLDENWIDVTGDCRGGENIANEIRQRVKDELGITVSIGVSFNKIFAKLGSDYKKPDAVTVITKSNFQEIVWPLPCSDLLFVGRATAKKLNSYGIYTIGELALADVEFLKTVFGKNGETLHSFANGLDVTPVRHKDEIHSVKSIGNSTTAPRDLVNDKDVKLTFMVLCDSVARRMREQGFKGKTVTITVRDKNLKSFTKRTQMSGYSDVSSEILKTALKLFNDNYNWYAPVRSLGIQVGDFDFDKPEQFDLEGKVEKREKMQKLEVAIDGLKKRFGNYCIQRASMLEDTELSSFNPHDEHIIHPVGFIS